MEISRGKPQKTEARNSIWSSNAACRYFLEGIWSYITVRWARDGVKGKQRKRGEKWIKTCSTAVLYFYNECNHYVPPKGNNKLQQHWHSRKDGYHYKVSQWWMRPWETNWPFYIFGGSTHYCNHYRNKYGDCSKSKSTNYI